jgi:hypothetical protein
MLILCNFKILIRDILLSTCPKAHPVCETGNIIPCVGNLMEEKRYVNMFEFSTDI